MIRYLIIWKRTNDFFSRAEDLIPRCSAPGNSDFGSAIRIARHTLSSDTARVYHDYRDKIMSGIYCCVRKKFIILTLKRLPFPFFSLR